MDAVAMDRKPRLRQMQKEQTREIILNAARTLFYKLHIGNVSVSQIVEEAGVGRQTFYFHFRDKEDVISRLVDEYNARGAVIMSRLPTGRPSKDQLREWLFEFSRFLEEVKAEYSVLFQLSQHPTTEPAYGRPTADIWVRALGQRSASFAAAQAGGRDGERARARAWRLLMDITWAATMIWQHHGSVFADEVVSDALELLHAFLHDRKYGTLAEG